MPATNGFVRGGFLSQAISRAATEQLWLVRHAWPHAHEQAATAVKFVSELRAMYTAITGSHLARPTLLCHGSALGVQGRRILQGVRARLRCTSEKHGTITPSQRLQHPHLRAAQEYRASVPVVRVTALLMPCGSPTARTSAASRSRCLRLSSAAEAAGLTTPGMCCSAPRQAIELVSGDRH